MLVAQGHWGASFSKEDGIDGLDAFVAGVERRGGAIKLEQRMLVFLKKKIEMRQVGEAGG